MIGFRRRHERDEKCLCHAQTPSLLRVLSPFPPILIGDALSFHVKQRIESQSGWRSDSRRSKSSMKKSKSNWNYSSP